MGSSSFPRLRGADATLSRTQDAISQQIEPMAQALAATPIMGATPQPWVNISRAADFVDIGGTNPPASYRKDQMGYVFLRAALTTAAGSAANAVVIGTLPIGYRPAYTMRFPVRGTAATFQSVTVSPTGSVRAELVIAAGGTIDLTGICFLAEV